MPRSRYRAAQFGGSADEVESAFYDALHNGDLAQLMACWADEDDIVCVHPGGPRLVGHDAVRAAFEALFANGSVKAVPEKLRRLDAGGCSVHSVVEQVEVMLPDGLHQAVVLTTNVYHKTPEGWRMVAHHASPGGALAADAHEQRQPVLH